MENQEFDIELLEKKLEEYEQADSNVRSEEVLEFVKKVLDITLLQLSKGNVSDRDIEEDIRFVRDEIGKPDFLKQLVLHVQQAADRWASASKEENGQDYLFSELCLLIKLGRNAVCTLGFLCCREGKFGVLYDFMTAGNQVLIGKANVPTELSLNSKPQLAGARKIVVSPLAEEYSLYHYNWIQDNIKKVDKATNGKVGYIYIPDMGPEGLNEFSRYFYPQLDKEGLIIDDRANGGGNVSPMILERLSREPYRLTMRRGSSLIGTVPDAVQVGPKVCLINKYSASDGDLFPWGFRALGLGKLIGTRTWGGIIGISGPLPYMDGTDIRVPFFTSYDPKTGNWIIENHGVDPDILIDNDPIKEWNGEDQQLDRAIEEVMKQLKERKPLAPVPAPRDWSHK